MKEKAAIVTRGSRGIGRETSLLLAKNGYKVCVNYNNNRNALDAVVDDITKVGGTAIAVQANVANAEDKTHLDN